MPPSPHWSTKDLGRFESRRMDGLWVIERHGDKVQVSPPAGRAYPLSLLLALSRPGLSLAAASLLAETASDWALATGDVSLALSACRTDAAGFEAVTASRRYACMPRPNGRWTCGRIRGNSAGQLLERLETHLANGDASGEVETDIQMARDFHSLSESLTRLLRKQVDLGRADPASCQLTTLIDDHRRRLGQLCDLEIGRLCPTPPSAAPTGSVVPLDAYRARRRHKT
jgi:hypothetical protein